MKTIRELDENFIGIVKELKNNKFEFNFPYNQKIVSVMRIHPKRKFDPAKKSWILETKSHEEKKAFLNIIDQFKWSFMDVKTDIEKMRKDIDDREKVLKENLQASVSKSSDFEVRQMNFDLYPYQVAGVEYLVKNKRVLLADQMGLGKTIETIAAVNHQQAFKSLHIVPNSLKLNWKREWEKWVSGIKVIVIDSSDDIRLLLRDDFDIYIMNYNSATKFEKELKNIKFESLVIDESHMVKNSKAKRTKAIVNLAKKIEIVYELTGTAIVNRPVELISQLNILGVLDDFGGAWKFMMRYCDGKRGQFGWDFSGASNTEELHENLRKYCYIRRETEDVLPELPKLTESIVDIEISNRAKYKRAENNLIEFIKKEKSFKEDQIKKWYNDNFNGDWDDLTKEEKRSAFSDFRGEKAAAASAAEHLVMINELKKITAEGKIKGMIEWIEDFLENDKKIVIAVHHTFIGKKLAEYFKCRFIYGQSSPEERQNAVDDFQENINTKIIILNIAVGSVGLTLTAAHHLAFTELPWTYGDCAQMQKRIHRIGQEFPSYIHYLLGKNTIDQDIYDLILEKKIVTQAVNQGINGKSGKSIMNELLKRISNK